MATSSRSAERFKYGICLNDECSKCKSKEVQQIPMRKELVCSECGKPLRETVPPTTGPDWKKIGIIAAAVAVIGGGAGTFFALGGSGDSDKGKDSTQVVTPTPPEPIPEPMLIEQITPTETAVTIKAGETKALSYTTVPQAHDEAIISKSSDEAVATISPSAEVTGVKAGKATITFTAEKSGKEGKVEVTVKDSSTPPPPPQPSWGKYEGPRNSSEKPEGNGILRITRQHTINGETAQPGERIEGVFRDGYVNLGTWFKNDGNTVVVKGLKVM